MRRALALAALLLASSAFAGSARINSMVPSGTTSTGYQMALQVVCMGAAATAGASIGEVLVVVLVGDTKAQVRAKAATAIIAFCASKGVTVTGADIGPD